MAITEPLDPHIPEWTLGDRLRKAREWAGLEPKELAEMIGVSDKSILRWEKGRVQNPRNFREVIAAWSNATGVPETWLLGYQRWISGGHLVDPILGQLDLPFEAQRPALALV